MLFRYALNDNGIRTGELFSNIEIFDMGAGDDIVDLTTPTSTSPITPPLDSFLVFGGDGRDMLWSSTGADTLVGGNGGDWLAGGAGNDNLYGGNLEGAETGAGADWNVNGISGSFSNVLDGGAGNDTIVGGSGKDLIFGGRGNDTLSGGDGADTFAFQFNYAPDASWGVDTILDFNYAGGDRLKGLDWGPGDLTASVVGSNTVLDYADMAAQIVLQNFNLTTSGLTVGDLFA